MSPFARPRRFSALLAPSGLHLVEYRWGRGDLRVLSYTRDLDAGGTPAAAARRLGELLEAAGGRGGHVSLAVSGFGSYHQILSLPPAPPEVLRPVIAREMRRFYPDLFSVEREGPIIEYAPVGGRGGEQGGPGRDLLVAAAPRSLVRTVTQELGLRGVHLDHWTVLPRALERLYRATSDETRSAAVLLLTPGAPLLGVFHEGELRLFSEPVGGVHAMREPEVDTLAEMVSRGALFLRQQFRGASLELLLLAADADAAPGLATELGRRTGLEVRPFALYEQSPGALAALGAALDGASPDGLTLLPPESRPASASERWTRALAVASVAVLIGAAAWWAAGALRAERQAAARLEAVEREALAFRSAVAPVEEVARQRQAHAHRARLLELLARNRQQLPEALWPLQAAAPLVEVEQLQIRRAEAGWQVAMTALAHGRTTAEATDAVDALFHQLSAQLPDSTVELQTLSYAPPAGGREPTAGAPAGGIALTFQLTFIVPIQPESPP